MAEGAADNLCLAEEAVDNLCLAEEAVDNLLLEVLEEAGDTPTVSVVHMKPYT